MVANLLSVAGVDHIITIDLHASQMQGFFKSPVDNLVAEPLISHWIRHYVPDWKNGVVVSKNPGGTKRVTSLADALKLSFGIVTTNCRRLPTGTEQPSLAGSIIFERDRPTEAFRRAAAFANLAESSNDGMSSVDISRPATRSRDGPPDRGIPSTPPRKEQPRRPESRIRPGTSEDGIRSLDALVSTTDSELGGDAASSSIADQVRTPF